ncbi:hypothetical protein Tco_0539353 [Tanacetum coccineum]
MPLIKQILILTMRSQDASQKQVLEFIMLPVHSYNPKIANTNVPEKATKPRIHIRNDGIDTHDCSLLNSNKLKGWCDPVTGVVVTASLVNRDAVSTVCENENFVFDEKFPALDSIRCLNLFIKSFWLSSSSGGTLLQLKLLSLGSTHQDFSHVAHDKFSDIQDHKIYRVSNATRYYDEGENWASASTALSLSNVLIDLFLVLFSTSLIFSTSITGVSISVWVSFSALAGVTFVLLLPPSLSFVKEIEFTFLVTRNWHFLLYYFPQGLASPPIERFLDIKDANDLLGSNQPGLGIVFPQLDNEDWKQIDTDDLEEMDAKGRLNVTTVTEEVTLLENARHQGIRGIEMEMLQEGLYQWKLLQMPWLFKMG